MFRAAMCPSAGELIVSVRHLVYVTLYRWPFGVHCTPNGHLYRYSADGAGTFANFLCYKTFHTVSSRTFREAKQRHSLECHKPKRLWLSSKKEMLLNKLLSCIQEIALIHIAATKWPLFWFSYYSLRSTFPSWLEATLGQLRSKNARVVQKETELSK